MERATPPEPAADERPAAPTPAPEGQRRFSVEETEKRLLQTRERDDVARALLDFAAGLAPRAVLFVVRQDEVAAWLWSGDGIDGEKLAALRLRPRAAVALRRPAARPERTSAARSRRCRRTLALAACFAAPAITGDLLVLPVKVKERLVAALLVEPRPATGSELDSGDLADLQRVIAKAEIAFELCIMQSKLRKA